jgi:hypothetical protein
MLFVFISVTYQYGLNYIRMTNYSVTVCQHLPNQYYVNVIEIERGAIKIKCITIGARGSIVG